MKYVGRSIQGFRANKRRMSFSLLCALIAAVLTLASCRQEAPTPNLERLRQDTQWMVNLRKWVDLAYVARSDVALFGGLNDPHPLGPSLYTTHAVVRLLKAAGIEVADQDKIADWIESIRDERGAFVDPFLVGSAHFTPPQETEQAVEVLRQLGTRPRDVELTTQYLLSLKYNDGTFLLDAERGPVDIDEIASRRLEYGTNYVVSALYALGLVDKVPVETRSALTSDIERLLGEGSFPSFPDLDAFAAASDIRMLAEVDPALVSEREGKFVANELKTITGMAPDAYIFTRVANDLLDLADLLGLPEAHDPQVLDAIRSYFTKKIVPLQNSNGGFGSPDTIEPLTTSENVILAGRLGVPYPNLDKLLSQINRHWLGYGWAAFTDYQPNNSDIGWTYNGVELATLAGYKYDKAKVTNFLRGFLSREAYENMASPSLQTPGAVADWGLRDLYYVIKGLKAVNGSLTAQDKKKAETRWLELVNNGATGNFGFWYVLPISREVGFSPGKEVVARVRDLAQTFKDTGSPKEEYPSTQILEYLWMSTDPEGLVMSKDEIKQYLDKLYDEKTGFYVSPAMDGLSIQQGVPSGTPRPDIFQTYFAMRLLSELGESLPDKNKTVDSVFGSRQKYGFGREPTWPYQPNIMNTWAGLMILKQIE